MSDWKDLTRMANGERMVVERVRLAESGVAIEGSFDLPPLAQLDPVGLERPAIVPHRLARGEVELEPVERTDHAATAQHAVGEWTLPVGTGRLGGVERTIPGPEDGDSESFDLEHLPLAERDARGGAEVVDARLAQRRRRLHEQTSADSGTGAEAPSSSAAPSLDERDESALENCSG